MARLPMSPSQVTRHKPQAASHKSHEARDRRDQRTLEEEEVDVRDAHDEDGARQVFQGQAAGVGGRVEAERGAAGAKGRAAQVVLW